MSTTVIVLATGGSRSVVRTADSVARHGLDASSLVLAATCQSALLQAQERRLGSTPVVRPVLADAVNGAADATRSDLILLLPSGYRLDMDCLERCESALAASSGAVGAAPAIRLQSPDGTRAVDRRHDGLAYHALISDPTTAPPVLCVRREIWEAVLGLDPLAGALSVYDLALRLLQHGRILDVADAAVRYDLAHDAGWPVDSLSDESYLSLLRYVFDKHRDSIELVLREALISSEIGFGRLRERHRVLLDTRDEDLKTLDALRSETAHLRAWLHHHNRARFDWGDFHRTNPISRDWGYDRGQPIDRYYIHEFLAAHSSDIHGSVLEVQEDDLTRTFGGRRVDRSDVVDLDDRNRRANLVADLRAAPHLPDASYDCVILTQTLHVIDDATAVLREIRRLLKPGGVLLATLPSASRVCLEYGEGGDLWRVTPDGAARVFDSVFGSVETVSFGNVLTNVGFLHGLACEEVDRTDFDPVDPYHPLVVGVRATNRIHGATRRAGRGAVLLYHRIANQPALHGLAISESHFEAQLAWLRRECHVVPLDRLLRTPVEDLPDRAVALTFDDGYVDNLEKAAPILERLGLPATFFVTTGSLERPGEYWWDTLERLVTTDAPLPALHLQAGTDPLALPLGTRREREEAHARLHSALIRAGLRERAAIVGAMAVLIGQSPSTSVRPMCADELLTLSRIPGMSLGAHTVNHLSLAEQDDETVRREMDDCGRALERITGSAPLDVAYPYGAVNRTALDAARAGWRWGLACDDRPVPISFDAARVPRIEVRNEGADSLAAKLASVFA